MSREWPGYQVVGAFFALIASAGIVLRLLVTHAKKKLVRRHVVVDAWVLVAQELVRRGVGAPDVLAAILASYDLRLERPEPVTARLPAAVASVSDALQIQLLDVARPLVARASDEAGAAALIEELRGVRKRLDELPGVAAVGVLWPEDPRIMASLVAHYGRMVAIPPPRRKKP
jgi:hypothetical protein